MSNKDNIITDGDHFKFALAQIGDATDEERQGMTDSTTSVIKLITGNYEAAVGAGYVGKSSTGIVDASAKKPGPVGLMYGRIQSGKTRAMILGGAMALDNHFRIVIILTTDINRLVGQTHQDFIDGLPTAKIYSKNSGWTDNDADFVSTALEDDDYGVVLVGSKGAKTLDHLTDFLNKIGGGKYPTVIFDDEGDQATLDTNTKKRSTKDSGIEASTIHALVHSAENKSIRNAVPYSAFVSVTGTPQGIFLQNIDSDAAIKFVYLLEAGKSYVGGKEFFGSANPAANNLIHIVPEAEADELIEGDGVVPDGLLSAISFFLVSATSMGMTSGNWKEYKMLCHTSSKQVDHETVSALIDQRLKEVMTAIRKPGEASSKLTIAHLKVAYDELKKTQPIVPAFDDVVATIGRQIRQKSSMVVNGNFKGDITYSKQYNFIVGGNTIGRGLAFKQLLVTYYTREPKQSMADTMYQHARMFGYRAETVKYTKVFIPATLYGRFHEIYKQDEEAREFIQSEGIDNDGNLILRTVLPGVGLKPTRSNVIDANRVKVIYPGKAIYPNMPIYKKGEVEPISLKVQKVLNTIDPEFIKNNKGEKTVSVEVAQKLVKAFKTKATNSWADRQVANYLKSFAKQLKNDNVIVRYRDSNRTDTTGIGYLDNGVHGKADLVQAREEKVPTLWVFKINPSDTWDGVEFFYPTLIPPSNSSPFIFNNRQ